MLGLILWQCVSLFKGDKFCLLPSYTSFSCSFPILFHLLQAMYSSVLPGHYLSGHVAGQIQFPGWLGKNSRASKMHRLCQEIHAHTRLRYTAECPLPHTSLAFYSYLCRTCLIYLFPLWRSLRHVIAECLVWWNVFYIIRMNERITTKDQRRVIEKSGLKYPQLPGI